MTIYVNHVPHADDVDLPPSLLTSTMPIALHVLFGHYWIKDGISEIACEVDRGRLTQGFNHKERRNLSLMRLCTSFAKHDGTLVSHTLLLPVCPRHVCDMLSDAHKQEIVLWLLSSKGLAGLRLPSRPLARSAIL